MKNCYNCKKPIKEEQLFLVQLDLFSKNAVNYIHRKKCRKPRKVTIKKYYH